MSNRLLAVLVAVAASAAFAADSPRVYADAKAMWEKSKDRPDYQPYASEFVQFNNHFHLDEKDGCYALSPGPVNLMLIISNSTNAKYAVVERVLSDVDNAKSQCFKKSYGGIRTKVPPYLPFVLQMSMG
jgi:hypothetical protein